MKPKKSKASAKKHFKTKSPEETKQIAADIMKELSHKGIVCLFGTLGAGKTTFVKGCLEGLGLAAHAVKSPTYAYIREHEVGGKRVAHVDLYRWERNHAVASALLQQAMEREPHLTLVEWAENLGPYLPAQRTDVKLAHDAMRDGESARVIEIVTYE